MSIFISENGIRRQIINIFTNINGTKKQIVSAWANKDDISTKIFGSSENGIIQITANNTYVAKSGGQTFTLTILDTDNVSYVTADNELLSVNGNNITIAENATINSEIPVTLQNDEVSYTVRIIIAPTVSNGFYEIYNTDDLTALRRIVLLNAVSDVNQNAKLMNDIDLSPACSSSSGISWTGIGTSAAPYHGIFDGQDYTLSNIYINYSASSAYARGFFGYTRDAIIRNTTINGKINCTTTGITGTVYVGAFCGYALSNTRFENLINNCGVYATYSNANSSMNYYTGGICGFGYGAKYISCINNGSISGRKYTGGISGRNGNATDCQNTANISATNGDAGGIIGSEGSTINCKNTGNVSATSSASCAGGIIGSYGGVENCWNTGTISATNLSSGGACGGIIGSTNIQIHNCCNTGQVSVSGTSSATSTYAGGIAGRCINSIHNCYNTGYVNGYNMAGGIVGYFQNISLSNCYNVGTVNIKATGYKSNLIGFYYYSKNYSITNCYILSGSFYNTSSTVPPVLTDCTTVSADVLKTYADILGDYFTEDTSNINNGYPVLTFQMS